MKQTNSKPKIIFFGNSASKFSNGVFNHFLAADCQVSAVVDTPAENRLTTSVSRGGAITETDFITLAKDRNILVYIPDSPNQSEFVNMLKELEPDALILCGYTKLIKDELLSVAKIASINFHASLLPKYKGKHPIFWAIRGGETFSGLTAHHLNNKLDEGNIAFQSIVPIEENDSVETVYDKVIAAGEEMVKELCRAIAANAVPNIPQQGEGSYFSGIQPKDWQIRPTLSANEIYNMVRATPGKCYIEENGNKTFIWKAILASQDDVNLLDKEKLLSMYERMVLIRKYEERVYYLFLEGTMPGSIHQSHGQEACAVGTMFDLRDDDYMGSTHRPAGHDLAKGVSLNDMMCEMFAKKNGCCGAKGGAMHTGDISKGVLPANAIVAANMPIMCGVALAFQMRRTDQVAVSFFGDGATNEGAFHEAINGAAIWKLPVIFVCENNLYGASTPIRTTCLLENPAADRAAAYGIPGFVVDGNDVLAVYEAMAKAVSRARAGEGPTILELKTYRYGGHSRNDACAYRTREEEAEWRERDPIKRLGEYMSNAGICEQSELSEIEKHIEKQVEDAVEFARNSPEPAAADALRPVYWEDRELN